MSKSLCLRFSTFIEKVEPCWLGANDVRHEEHHLVIPVTYWESMTINHGDDLLELCEVCTCTKVVKEDLDGVGYILIDEAIWDAGDDLIDRGLE